ncbi:MAG TPA: phosphatase PAP2 family protein [Pseudolabrys sp.]|nr:phosphatase PAP2 family protein [Pseudolabrys sp.]
MYASLLNYFDLPILHAINGFCGESWIRDRLISHLALDFKWAVPLCLFWMLWFQPAEDQLARRQRLLVIIAAVLLSLVVNRTISVLMPFRVRPMETSDIGYHMPLFQDRFHFTDFEPWSSFPSDQATFFFAFAAGFWLLSRPLGIVMAAYSTLIVLSRIYLGTHFPSDILTGTLLGIAVMLVLDREWVRNATIPLLALEKAKPAYFNTALFFVLLEMGTGFMNVRDIGRSFFHLLRAHHGA